MDSGKRERLEKAGWTFGSADTFLHVSPEETAFLELRLALSDTLKERRTGRRMSQQALAEKIGSSQSRVAKMEASDPSVSIDLIVRALLATGATSNDIAAAIRRKPRTPA